MPLEVITLRDEAAGTSAKVLPGYGFNCFSFEGMTDSGPVEVLWSDPEFCNGDRPPARSGIPLLFPFAGRIRGAAFKFGGKQYELEPAAGQQVAIHGFVLRRAWRVLEHGPRRVVGTFQAVVDDPSLLDRWPADFCITVAYELSGNLLSCEVKIENPDSRPLPFGFGTHGYYRVPIGSEGSANDCRIVVPALRQWELVDMLPSGRVVPAPEADRLSAGMAFGETNFDTVLTDLKRVKQIGRCFTSIYDPHSDRELSMTFDQQFPHCVLFNPAHREAVCIEPYTAVPDAFWLVEHGIEAGLRVLLPGMTFRTQISTSLI